jgi:hypothetical protein
VNASIKAAADQPRLFRFVPINSGMERLWWIMATIAPLRACEKIFMAALHSSRRTKVLSSTMRLALKFFHKLFGWPPH